MTVHSPLLKVLVQQVQEFLNEYEPIGNGERREAQLTASGKLLVITNLPLPDSCYKRWRDDYHQRVDAEGFREIPAANCPACGMPLAAGNRIALPRDGSSDQTTWNELAEFRAQRTHKLAEGQ